MLMIRSATGGSPNNISSLTRSSSHPNNLIVIDEIEVFLNTNLTLVLTHWNDNEVKDENVDANLLQLILVGKPNNRPT